MIPEHSYVTNVCPAVTAILSRIGDKWSVMIVLELANGPRRFNEIKRDIAGISQRMLTLTLRGLERDGLVSRKVYDTVPPKVEYSLTALGRSLQGPVMALGEWAISNKADIHASQEAFDRRMEEAVA